MYFLKNKIAFPDNLAQALSTSFSSLPTVHAEKLGELWNELTQTKGVSIDGVDHYGAKNELTMAYAKYYLPSNVLKLPLIMEEAFLLDNSLWAENTRWLDFGCGPGTAYWGLAWWASKRNLGFHYTGLDRSKSFVQLAQNLLRRASGFSFPSQFTSTDLQDPKSLSKVFQEVKPSHVSIVNALHEMAPSVSEKATLLLELIKELRISEKKTGQRSFLILVEPGTKEHSREMITAVQTLVENKEVLVHFPCTDQRKCGALIRSGDWCHEEIACEFPEWFETLGKSAGLSKSSIIFSYFVLSPYRPTLDKKSMLLRAVSQRLEQKGQMECFLCTSEGRCKVRVQRSKITDSNEKFLAIRRGDYLRNLKTTEKGDFLAGEWIQPNTSTVFSEIN